MCSARTLSNHSGSYTAGRLVAVHACHNDSFAAMAVGLARKSGFTLDEKTATRQVKANVFGLEKLRDNLHQGFFAPVGDFFAPFVVE